MIQVLFLQASNSRTLARHGPPRVAEAVWKAVQGHLPPRPPDLTRWAATGCASRTGTASTPSWPDSPAGCCWTSQPGPAGQVRPPCEPRRTEWLAAAVFDKLVEEAIAGYDKIIGLDPSEVAVDVSLHHEVCCSHRTVTQEGRISPEEEGSLCRSTVSSLRSTATKRC